MLLLGCYTFFSELDQNFKFGGTIGCGDSYLEVTFCHSKVFRLHVILYNDSGALRSQSDKVRVTVTDWTGTKFMFDWSRDPLLLFRKTLSALHFQIFRLLKQYSCVVLDIELADRNLLSREFLLMGMFRDTQFVLQRCTNP